MSDEFSLDFSDRPYVNEHEELLKNIERDSKEQEVFDKLQPQQIKALMLRSHTTMSIPEIASECGVTASIIRSWEQLPEYKLGISKEIERGFGLTRKSFFNRNMQLVNKLYDEIQRRLLCDDNVKKMQLTTLMRNYRELANVQIRMTQLAFNVNQNNADPNDSDVSSALNRIKKNVESKNGNIAIDVETTNGTS